MLIASFNKLGMALALVILSSTLAAKRARADEMAAPPVATLGATPAAAPQHQELAVMLGLGQWALGGANVAAQTHFGRLALEYSHGQGVHLSNAGFLMNSSEKAAGADVRMPWTTGLGIGLLVTRNLRVLVEFKANHYQLQGGDPSSRLEYTTYTIGPGLFYEIRLWRGLFLQPSIRWWPTVASTFQKGSTLRNAAGAPVAIAEHSSGVFPNVNLGWEF